ncbi:MAG: NAD(P)H-hydrate dehydratase, partial [Candidatus Nanohaloarchaea archaeon]
MELERKKESHKGENGRVAVIGGSIDFTGAPALSAQAALRTGCDLARVLTSDSVRGVVAGFSENLIVESFGSDYFDGEAVEQALKLDEWADAVVIGPGIGDAEAEAVKEFLQRADSPMVVDADALRNLRPSDVEDAVLTPHRGEFQEVEDELDTFLKNGNVVLRKGPTDKIYLEEGVEEVEAGHPGMTVGGTGDVLTGVLAGLIAQGMDKEEAAVKAAKVSGKAGEKAAEKYGNGLLATDLLEEIPKVLF